MYFELASFQFSQDLFIPTQNENFHPEARNWFISQKKIYLIMEQLALSQKKENALKAAEECVFLMNLFKLFQRKWVYKQQSNMAQYEKVQQIIKDLWLKRSNEIIPSTIGELQGQSIRVAILFEKHVGRTYKILDSDRLIDHLRKMQTLITLCEEFERDPIEAYFNGKGYSADLEIEMWISIYKFLRRFILVIESEDEKLKGIAVFNLIQLLDYVSSIVDTQQQYQLQQQQQLLQFQMVKLNYKLEKKDNKQLIFLKQHSTEIVLKQMPQVPLEQLNYILCIVYAKLSQRSSVKKIKYRRTQIMGTYYFAHFQLMIDKPQDALMTLSDICGPNTSDLVHIYKQYDKSSIEKDNMLATFLNHDSIFLYDKFRILSLYSKLLSACNQLDTLNTLVKRLQKCMIVNERGDQVWINKCFGLQFVQCGHQLFQKALQCEDKEIVAKVASTCYSYFKKSKYLLKLLSTPTMANLINQVIIHNYKIQQEGDTQQESSEIIMERAMSMMEAVLKKKNKKTGIGRVQQHQSQQQQQQLQLNQVEQLE